MLSSPFILNKEYKRTEIQEQYGGNKQAGIVYSRQSPYIFIFSQQSGHQHGYIDRWENENVFSYTGQGQVGDMRFISGNLALREHLSDGKRVFLFTGVRKAYVKFEAELEFLTFDYFQGPDREGNTREAIKFFFKRVGTKLPYEHDIPLLKAAEDEPNFLKHPPRINIPNETERKGLVTSRIGQGAYRKSVLFRWEFKCAVTNYSKTEVLIASHIVPWKQATNDERLDVNNGILLSPVYDALFDRHLISFEDNGKIILSDELSSTKYQELGITGNEKIRNLSADNSLYLEKHRLLLK